LENEIAVMMRVEDCMTMPKTDDETMTNPSIESPQVAQQTVVDLEMCPAGASAGD
jgi:hypothetical protein